MSFGYVEQAKAPADIAIKAYQLIYINDYFREDHFLFHKMALNYKQYMKTDKSTKPKARRPDPAKAGKAKRRPAVASRPAQAEVMPRRQAWATPNEKAQYCALRATGTPQAEAYRLCRPETARDGCASQGKRWDADMAAEIAALKEAAALAASQAHGVTAAWLVGEMKGMYETPLGAIDASSRYCKKYKVTETMTDAGPKTTIEVEKPCPLATLQAIAKQTGLEAKPAALGLDVAIGTPTVRDLMAALIRPGSPIARRLEVSRAV